MEKDCNASAKKRNSSANYKSKFLNLIFRPQPWRAFLGGGGGGGGGQGGGSGACSPEIKVLLN